jgi:hypothetical protein
MLVEVNDIYLRLEQTSTCIFTISSVYADLCVYMKMTLMILMVMFA